MKRWMMGAAAAALVLMMGVVGVSAAQTGQGCRLWQKTDRCGAQVWEGCRYTDADGDGVCDNRQSGLCSGDCGNWSDADGDGVCDNQQSGLCSGDCGNWSDADGDGLCDGMGLQTGHHGGHHGRNW